MRDVHRSPATAEPIQNNHSSWSAPCYRQHVKSSARESLLLTPRLSVGRSIYRRPSQGAYDCAEGNSICAHFRKYKFVIKRWNWPRKRAGNAPNAKRPTISHQIDSLAGTENERREMFMCNAVFLLLTVRWIKRKLQIVVIFSAMKSRRTCDFSFVLNTN